MASSNALSLYAMFYVWIILQRRHLGLDTHWQNCIRSTTSLQSTTHTDIRNEMQLLFTESKRISAKFSSVISDKVTELQMQKSLLMIASSPSEIDLSNTQTLLTTIREMFIENNQELVKMQGTTHTNIELCRGMKASDEQSIKTKTIELGRIQSNISYLEFRIKNCEHEMHTLDSEAKGLENQARNLKEEARARELSGVNEGLNNIGLGLFFAPFTGGLSLIPASVAAGVNIGIGIVSSMACSDNANRLRESASEKRVEARNCLQQKRTSVSEKDELERQIRSLERHIEELEKGSCVLSDIKRFLLNAVDVTNRCIDALQDVDMALKDTQLQGESFLIIQAAFTNNPEKVNARARRHMDKLKEKWNNLEQAFRQIKAIE